jgi:hypothetical protein
MVREAPSATQVHLDLAMRAWSHYNRRNVLPAEGAWLDQTRSFLACVDLIDAESAYWQIQVDEHHQRQAEAARRQSQATRRR